MERLFALWNQAMQKPWIAKCWQFIKFGIVGVSNTLISLAVYQLALNALGLHYLAANALGLVISVVNAYYWNNRCVFGGGQKRSFSRHVALYFKSLTAYGGTFVLDSVLLVFWVEAVGVPEALVQADADAFTPLAAAYGLPRETPEQQARKKNTDKINAKALSNFIFV